MQVIDLVAEILLSERRRQLSIPGAPALATTKEEAA